jgi:hypothetical protein
MPSTTMTIKLITPPADGKPRGSIVGTDDQRLGVFAEKIGLFECGKTYDIEYVETSANGRTLRNVKSATLKAGASPQAQQAAATPSNGTGGTGNGNGFYRPTSPTDAERMFVCATLTALIRAGEVKNDKQHLWTTTQMLRNLWHHTFGEVGTFTPGEAGKPRLVAAE